MSKFQRLETMNKYRQITDDEFEQLILVDKSTAIVVFAADWFGSAAMIHTMMERFAADNTYDIKFFHINIDHHSRFANQFCLSNRVEIFFFDNGEVVDHQRSLTSRSRLLQKLMALQARTT